MSSTQLPIANDGSDEIAGLIETLSATDQRLEVLTEGQVDAVVTSAGNTIMLQRSQDLLLQHEARRQASVLDALPACVGLVDSRGTIVTVNKTWRQFIREAGQPGPGDPVGANYLDVCDRTAGPDAQVAQAVATGMRAVLRGDLPTYSLEYACHRKGVQRWFLLTVTPLDEVRPFSAVVTHLDITQRTKAQHSMQRSTELLEAVMSGTPDLVFVKDREGRYLFCNAAFARFVGRTADEIVGATNALIYPADRKAHDPGAEVAGTSADRLVMSSGEPVTTEDLLTGVAGQRIFLATKAPFRNDAGEVVGVIGISRDITERKRAETELSESQTLLRMASRLTLVASWYLEVPTRHLVWSEDLAWLHDEPRGFTPTLQAAMDYIAPEHRADMTRALETCIETGMPFDIEVELVTATGRRIWVHAIGEAVRDQDGSVCRVQGAVQDRSERKLAELETRDLADRLVELNLDLEARVQSRTADLTLAREAAEQANRAKSAFLATMSHEIRTPMNGVVGMIDVLEQSGLRSSQVGIVRTVRESANALLRIVDDVLDFSKIEAGRFDIDREPMALGRVAQQVCDTLAHLAEDKGVRLNVLVDGELPQVLGDALRLRQVLLNLVGNAIKFSSGNGRVGRVGVHVRLHALSALQCTVDFVVEDDGIGMDDATRARLFQPFTQGDISTTRRFGGTGLGLSISHRIVELMGGAIQVTSKLGHGSRFTVQLPFEWIVSTPADIAAPSLVSESALDSTLEGDLITAPAPLSALGPTDARRLILVAEDNETNQQVIRLQLQLMGFASQIARTGLEALERWRSGNYAMLLTDLHMPDLDGFQLAAAIRAEELPGRHLPIVALTADAARSEVLRGREMGIDEHMVKPVQLIELRAMLEKWMPPDSPPAQLRPTATGRSSPRRADPIQPATQPTKVVQLDTLMALIGSDPAAMERVLAMFETSAAQARDAVRWGATSGNAKLIGDALHSLKSSAHAIGALPLAKACEEMEASASHSQGVLTNAELAGFEAHVAAVLDYLDKR